MFNSLFVIPKNKEQMDTSASRMILLRTRAH